MFIQLDKYRWIRESTEKSIVLYNTIMKKRYPRNTSEGFTLIELIVALGLFIVVIFIGVGSLLSVVDINRKAQAMRTAMDNLNLAMEEMSREIRMGTKYYCDPDLTFPIVFSNNVVGCDIATGEHGTFAFLDQNGLTIVYRRNGARIEKSRDGGATFVAVTAPGITIEYLKFDVMRVVNWADFTGEQPSMLIAIGGTAGVKDALLSKFTLQTWVVQRSRKI